MYRNILNLSTETTQKCFLRSMHEATILSPLDTIKNRDARKSFTMLVKVLHKEPVPAS